MSQLKTAFDQSIIKSKFPFFRAIKSIELRVKQAEYAYVEILLGDGKNVPQRLVEAARTENYVKNIMTTLKNRYKEAYGEEFNEEDFEVRVFSALAPGVFSTHIVGLKGTLPEFPTAVADLTIAFDYYDPKAVFTAGGTNVG